MPLVNPVPYISKAKEKKTALGAFNVYNLETVRAVVETAEEMETPVILQITPGTLRYAGLPFISNIVKTAADNFKVPVILHLDHCGSYDTIIQAIQHGFTSVMIDASDKPYQENIRVVKEVVKAAGAAGVAVEAEIGRIGGVEDDLVVEAGTFLTRPEEARKFVEDTDIDTLAVAIGTAHGVYKGEPKLDFGRLQEIEAEVNIPLVLHGASGVPEASVRRSVQLGICKVNIATDLKVPFARSIKDYLNQNPSEYDLRKYLDAGSRAVKKVVKRKIEMLGSKGLAK